MATRLSFYSQLSFIMDTMSKTTLSQVSKLVEDDTAELRAELSRLLFANSTLVKKISSLECELTSVKSDPPKSNKGCRSVAVQTACHVDDGDGDVSHSPTIEGIFGKEWCMDLWKNSLQSCTDFPHSSIESEVTLTAQVKPVEIKEEACLQEGAASSQHENSVLEAKHGADTDEDSEPQLDDCNSYVLPLDPNEEQTESTGTNKKETTVQLMSVNSTAETFPTHIIPIEMEDDEDDVQFVEASQLEQEINTELDLSQNELPSPTTDDGTPLDKQSQEDIDDASEQNTKTPNRRTFHCEVCNRTFFHKGTLTHHMKSHKPCFCSICKQHFPHKKKLKSHRCVPLLPSQANCKMCTVCGKTFANQSALRIHYVVHTGERPHKCSLCGKRFTQKGNLKCHLRIHTGERPFTCCKCGKRFTQKVNLNHHLLAHANWEAGEKQSSQKQLNEFLECFG